MEPRYVFMVEWYDIKSSLIRRYQLTYFLESNQIEMKSPYPGLRKELFYLGAVIMIHSRQLKVVDYVDVYTRKQFEKKQERTFAMIKPDATKNIGKILNMIQNGGFQIGNLKLARLTKANAEQFYAEHKGREFFDGLVEFVTSGPAVGLELIADGGIQKWRQFIGPTNVDKAIAENPNSVRALFGTKGSPRFNAVHGSDSPKSAERELNFFFGDNSPLAQPAMFKNCSLCIIKPHILRSHQLGQVVDQIICSGFSVSSMQMFYLDHPTSTEFFSVYKGVLPEFGRVCENMIQGPCVVLEVCQSQNVVNSFRELCGPHDPDIAKTLRGKTIRATFGLDRVRNAVHCTDLPEDGVLESEYFFKVLQGN